MAISAYLRAAVRFLQRWLRNGWVQLALGVLFGLGLGWLAIRDIQWTVVVEQFRGFPIVYALLSLGLFLLASLLRAYRWQVLFLRQKVPLMGLFVVQNAGLGLNNLLPVRLLSEVTQFAMLRLRYQVDSGRAIATLGVERVLDLVVTATLLLAGLTLLPDKGEFLPYIVGAFVVAVASLALVPLLVWVSTKAFLPRIPILVAVANSLREIGRAKGPVAYAFLLTLAYWLSVGLCAWILAFGMDLGISPFVATLAVLGTIYLATSLPTLPASVGTFEFGMVYVLRFFDVEQAKAFSYAMVIHAILFLPPIAVALMALPSFRLSSLRRMVHQGSRIDAGTPPLEEREDRP